MSDPIPVVVLARLGITRDHQGRGLGRALFQDAANRGDTLLVERSAGSALPARIDIHMPR
jgi:predicted N-acetyltransferase YhbS